MTPVAEVEQGVVERILARLGPRVVVGLPLGLGKPVSLVNALYRRVADQPGIELEIVTALSLDVPSASSDMEQRFLEPFATRHFGSDPERLDYVRDLERDEVPPNIRITEFYLRSGSSLGNTLAQRHYISANYTHVARDLMDRGVNLTMQEVAVEPGGGRLSLSCNPDVTLELAARMADAPDRECLMIARVRRELPFMHGDAIVERSFFDEVIEVEDRPRPLFAVPRQPVSPQDYAVGLHASGLIDDGGTLQIGIGALSDALVHALLLRHRSNDRYRTVLSALRGAPAEGEGLDPFVSGLYGASEMFMDGFMHLYRAGILTREVFDDERLQRFANDGDHGALGEHRGRGAVMGAAFFLGSRPFYDFLDCLEPDERPRFRMTSVERINQLYGGDEELEVLQRRGARFFNTCMMVTATGAAVSDGLADYQMVSGVGGQYNFVAMAHAMRDGRSVLMLRSTRGSGSSTSSNIVWEHPHATIPRHLRDIVVTEYGVAKLRGRTDEECIQALVGIMDARFQEALVATAKEAGKLDPAWEIPATARRNRPEALQETLAGDAFPRYPFGSDFTLVEERLVEGLQELKALAKSPLRMGAAWLRGHPSRYPAELARMGLADPTGWRDRAMARLLAHALDRADLSGLVPDAAEA